MIDDPLTTTTTTADRPLYVLADMLAEKDYAKTKGVLRIAGNYARIGRLLKLFHNHPSINDAASSNAALAAKAAKGNAGAWEMTVHDLASGLKMRARTCVGKGCLFCYLYIHLHCCYNRLLR